MVSLKQFDVFPNPNQERRATYPFLIVLQSDLMPDLRTRVVAPLISVGKIPGWERLMPEVIVQRNRYVISMPDLGAMPTVRMLPPVANLEESRYQIIGAIDMVFPILDMAEYWFHPKEKGIGAGVPISWKGWALFLTYVGSILAVPSVLQLIIGYEGTVPLRIACVAGLSVPFLFIAWKKTEGGWRWRRGPEDADDESRS